MIVNIVYYRHLVARYISSIDNKENVWTYRKKLLFIYERNACLYKKLIEYTLIYIN